MPKTNCALCVAHPGHELLIHQWLGRERPLVFILTDGSGFDAQPRLDYSRRMLKRIGAPMAASCGCFTDKQAYELILNGRIDLLAEVVMAFSSEVLQRGVHLIVADAAEGYNPVHDLGRMVTGATCALAARAGVAIAHYEFAIADPASRHATPADIRFQLSDLELQEKLMAARNYWPLRAEVATQLERLGEEGLRAEVLHPVANWCNSPAYSLPPRYEVIGDERVRSGRYRTVIRYIEHMQALQQKLVQWLEVKGAPLQQPMIRQRARGDPALTT